MLRLLFLFLLGESRLDEGVRVETETDDDDVGGSGSR
jgi:hypothetical protein